MGTTFLSVLLLVGMAYLIYRVDRLEKQVRGRSRRASVRVGPNGEKIIPILKDDIEPGPFADGNRHDQPEAPEDQK
ncbi:MAG TPA: hypothetical protein VGK74_27365 [Symbiobacteriaceae bacterium]